MEKEIQDINTELNLDAEGPEATETFETKTLNVSNPAEAAALVSDIEVVGDPDMFTVLSKASSEKQGWMKSTKAMPIEGTGVLVQVTTQQRNSDGSYAVAEALTFVPGVRIQNAGTSKILVRSFS